MRPWNRILIGISAAFIFVLAGCGELRTWPEGPLYTAPDLDPAWQQPETVEEAMAAIEGLYAHYDVVSYEDVTTKQTMRTFIVSYGFTEFRIEDGRLLQIDRFCHAEQKMNREGVESAFSDAATQAIEPRVQEVELRREDGQWLIFRPATPTLLGIDGDPSLPLPTDPDDPNITDPDGDGNPGVTVSLKMGSFMQGEIYITRREIYRNYVTLHSDGNLYGYVEDDSEQFVIDASLRVLRQESNMEQLPGPGMNPIILVRVDDGLDTCEELMAARDELFPPEPEFR